MFTFEDILTAKKERLFKITKGLEMHDKPEDNRRNLAYISKKNKISSEQIILALGFNKNIKELQEGLLTVGYTEQEKLTEERNRIYINDIYKKITLDNILALYSSVKQNYVILEVMQYLLRQRLKNIETAIEESINSLTINRYKIEMRAIYADNIADIDFAEERLSRKENGFRALLNETCMIVESKLLPIGDIFFRDTILPEEKRTLLNKSLIPPDLIRSRLKDSSISAKEQSILKDFLATSSENN